MVANIRVNTGAVKGATVTLTTDPWGSNEKLYPTATSPAKFKIISPTANMPFLVSVSAPQKSSYMYQGNISDKKNLVISAKLLNCKSCP